MTGMKNVKKVSDSSITYEIFNKTYIISREKTFLKKLQNEIRKITFLEYF